MKGFVLRWVINSLGLIFTALLMKQRVVLADPWTALIAAAILGVVNAILRPILLILTLPLNILTLGLFTFVVNGLMLGLVDRLVPGFDIRGGFGSTVLVALVLTLISWFIGGLVGD
ncbi:MAG: phage holin family protein [Bacillota bacterium]|nr:phage holin family protein [Bacillota bacterium]